MALLLTWKGTVRCTIRRNLELCQEGSMQKQEDPCEKSPPYAGQVGQSG